MSEKRKRDTRLINDLEDRQRKWVETLARTGSVVKAERVAYGHTLLSPENLEKKSQDLLNKPAVRELLIRIWDKEGFTLKKMAGIHHKLAAHALKESVRLEAVRMGYEVHGALDKKKIEGERDGDTYNFINLCITL